MGSTPRAIAPPTFQASKTYSYTYNGRGQRTGRSYFYFLPTDSIITVYRGEVTDYNRKYNYDNSGRLISETINKTLYGQGTSYEELIYLYDDSGIVGVQYTNGSNTDVYYFCRNLQGDVIAIYNTAGTKVVEYEYDAFGNCTIKSTTTNTELAHANPIRYRGYYYDEDTKLYYLNARYYSPEWRRFISPDDTSYLDPESVNGLNLYAYCNNDPINFADPSGHFGIWAIVALVGTAVILGGGGQVLSNAIAGETGSNLWRGVAGSALGSGTTALALLLSPFTAGASLAVSALLGAGMQTSVDVFETLIRGEDISFGQAGLDFGINFAVTLAGNLLGYKLIKVNSGWFKTQRFDSVFLKPYGQRLLTQTAIGAGLSVTINVASELDCESLVWEILFPSITPPIIPVNLYH